MAGMATASALTGDFDNDGDLDLFIANLAHPRYIEISDVSQLLRNDGLCHKVIGADTLWYWQFTDVTRKRASLTTNFTRSSGWTPTTTVSWTLHHLGLSKRPLLPL